MGNDSKPLLVDYDDNKLEEHLMQLMNFTDNEDSTSFFDSNCNTELCRAVTAVTYGILGLAGLVFNCAFCYVIWRNKKLHTVTHMLMTNLAASNILFLFFHPPFFMSTYILQTNWVFGTIMCKASFSVVYVTATGSFYFMSLVAIDRWLAIFRRRSRLTKRNCIWLTAVAWVICLTIASPYIYLSGEVHTLGNQQLFDISLRSVFPDLLPQDRVQCGIDCPSCKRLLQAATIIAQYGIPLCVMIPAYGHLAFFLWRRPTVGVQSRERFRKAEHRRRRMLLTLLAIVGFLILCWSPLFSVGVLHAYQIISNDSLSLYIYTSMIALLGVVLMPCFYLLNDGFRRQIFMLVYCMPLYNMANKNGHTRSLSHLEMKQNALKNKNKPVPESNTVSMPDFVEIQQNHDYGRHVTAATALLSSTDNPKPFDVKSGAQYSYSEMDTTNIRAYAESPDIDTDDNTLNGNTM